MIYLWRSSLVGEDFFGNTDVWNICDEIVLGQFSVFHLPVIITIISNLFMKKFSHVVVDFVDLIHNDDIIQSSFKSCF